MRYLFVFLLPLFLVFPSFADDIEITLKEQAAIDLCSYPSLKEGVIDLLYLHLDKLWHDGKYSKIFPVLKLITVISPSETEAWSLGGWFLINGIAPKLSGKEKERILNYALDFLKEGISKNPDNEQLYLEIAMYYYNKDEYQTAISYLEKIEPEIPSFHFLHLKAHIYRKLGENRKAVEMWEKIKEKFPYMMDVADRFIMELKDDSEKDN